MTKKATKKRSTPLERFLDSEEFDAAMYAYRTAPGHDPAVVNAQFECVQRLILKAASE